MPAISSPGPPEGDLPKTNKLPSLQFYPGDWRKDPGVQALSFHDRGVWFEILCLMHESDQRGKLLLNGLAMPDEALARLLGLDNQNLTTTLSTLLTYGVASRDEETGALICRRMVRDENLRQIRRTSGLMGGNPALLKQNPTTQLKQIPTPSSSSSSSTSVSSPNGEGEDPPAGPSPEDSLEAIVEAWNAVAPTRCKKLTDDRRRTLSARLRDAWWRENWRHGLARLPEARFLNGENDRGWKADFDWFLKPNSLVRLLETRYDTSGRSHRTTGPRVHRGDLYEPGNGPTAADFGG